MQLHRHAKEMGEAGANLTLIGQATPRHAAHFRRKLRIDLPMLADEDRVSYRAAGARMGTFGELLGPESVAKGVLRAARSRQLQGRVVGNVAQLGGTLVVRPDGSVAWSHMSESAADNPAPQEIVSAVRSLGG